MRRIPGYPAVASLLLAVTVAVGCGDSTELVEPQFGAVDVTVSTTSPATFIDTDGYVVTLDGVTSRPVGVNDALSLGAIPVGRHLVQLTGVAANCTVGGPNPRVVDIRADPAARQLSVVFEVVCSDPNALSPWDY